MGLEEVHWANVSEESWSEIEEFHRTMSTKLNHKNGDKTLQEDLLSERQEKIACEEGQGMCAHMLIVISIILIFLTFPFSLCCVVKVVQEYERAVIFRLGRLLKSGARGPGVFFIIPCVDHYEKIDMRTQTYDVPPQEILTKDSVTVFVNAIMYYKVKDATSAVANVDDYSGSAQLLAATTLRNVLGTRNLGDILSEREAIAQEMQSGLDEATDPWGVLVERVEVKDVRVPENLQRAMAAEAEAARNARAKVIAAEGEHKASRALRQAAEVILDSPAALQLRYLQTLNSISAENNSTIIFPVPIDTLSEFMSHGQPQPQQYPYNPNWMVPPTAGAAQDQTPWDLKQQQAQQQQHHLHQPDAPIPPAPTHKPPPPAPLKPKPNGEESCSLKHLIGTGQPQKNKLPS